MNAYFKQERSKWEPMNQKCSNPSPPKTAAAAVNSQARSPSERTEHPYHQLEAELHGLAKYVLGGVDQRPFPPANRPNRALLSKPRP